MKVDDDIFAVFIVESSQIKDLYIEKNSKIDKSFIESVFNILSSSLKGMDGEKTGNATNVTLGSHLWQVSEYSKLRILKIFEKDKIIVVLVKSNTQLHYTVVNIIGYYFESDDGPKSLF